MMALYKKHCAADENALKDSTIKYKSKLKVVKSIPNWKISLLNILCHFTTIKFYDSYYCG
jgi:hypothetical protein